MNNLAIEKLVVEIIEEELGVNVEQITSDASFLMDLGADSLDNVMLVMEFEQRFGMIISDDVAGKLTTVGKVVEYIKLNRAEIGRTHYVPVAAL